MLQAPPVPRTTGVRRLLAAEIISTTGSALTGVAIPWFVLVTTGSAARASFVMAAEIAPMVLFGFISGGWAERVGPRRWMLLSDAVRAPLVALVPLLYLLDALPFSVLLAVVFAVGVFSTPYSASQQILLAHVAGEDEAALTRATSTLQSATRLTMLLGPPTAGALIALLGAPAVLLIDAASYLVVLPLILGVDAPRRADDVRTSGLLAGLTTVFTDRLLRAWTIASVISEAAYQAVFVALPVLTLQRYHDSAALAGVLLAAFGGGAVAGSIFAARITSRVSGTRLAVAGKIGSAIAFVALIPAWPPIGLIVVLVGLGFANGCTNGPVAAIRLRRIAPAARPKALTAIATMAWLGGIAGLVSAGPVLDTGNAMTLFVGLAVVQVIAVTMFVAGARAYSSPR